MENVTKFLSYVIVLSLSFLTTPVLAQFANLVQNPSFEERAPINFCPTTVGGNNPAATNWDAPSLAFYSTDYFHTCANGAFNPNQNGAPARTGNGYNGFIAILPSSNYSEYLYQELAQPLVSGKTYYIEFYVRIQKNARYSVKHLGLYLANSLSQIDTKTEIQNKTPQIPNNFPSASYYSNRFGWTKISGTFTPSTSEVKHLVIGNFDNGIPNNQETVITNSFGCTSAGCCTTNNALPECDQGAYYFVEDVNIWDTDNCTSTFASSQVSVTGPSAVCPGNVYYYNAVVQGGHRPNYTYTWTKPSNWTVPSGVTNSPQIGLQVPTYNPSYGTVAVRVNNECGLSPSVGITVFPGYSCGSYFSIFPNPAGNKLTINVLSNNTDASQLQLASEKTEYRISLYNPFGKKVRDLKTKKESVEINTASLPDGIYNLKVQSKEGAFEEKIVIEH